MIESRRQEVNLVARSSTPEFLFKKASIFFLGRNTSGSTPSSLARFTSSWVRYSCARSSTIEEGPTPSMARCFLGITADSVSHPSESTRLASRSRFSLPSSIPETSLFQNPSLRTSQTNPARALQTTHFQSSHERFLVRNHHRSGNCSCVWEPNPN